MSTVLVLLGTAGAHVMPLDAHMPDAGALVRGVDIVIPARTEGITQAPVVVFEGRDGLRRTLPRVTS